MSTDDLDGRIAASETRIAKAVFPGSANQYDTLFSGLAMQLMDEAAFIAATRFARKHLVMVSSERIDFSRHIPVGSIMEVVARVVRVGRTSLTVGVEVFVERMDERDRERAVEGTFTLVAIDDDKQPVPVLDG